MPFLLVGIVACLDAFRWGILCLKMDWSVKWGVKWGVTFNVQNIVSTRRYFLKSIVFHRKMSDWVVVIPACVGGYFLFLACIIRLFLLIYSCLGGFWGENGVCVGENGYFCRSKYVDYGQEHLFSVS